MQQNIACCHLKWYSGNAEEFTACPGYQGNGKFFEAEVCNNCNTGCIYHLVEVSKGLVICHHHLSKLQALFRVDAHDVAQQEDVVRGEAHLLGIQDDLLELACLRKALDHLHANTTKPFRHPWNTGIKHVQGYKALFITSCIPKIFFFCCVTPFLKSNFSAKIEKEWGILG